MALSTPASALCAVARTGAGATVQPSGSRQSWRGAVHCAPSRLYRAGVLMWWIFACHRAVAVPLFDAPFLATDVGRSPRLLAIGDLDGDAIPDVVVARDGSANIVILLGSGDGTFEPGPEVVSPTTSAVALADLNGDGRLDLVASASRESILLVYPGNGDGSFAQSSPPLALRGLPLHVAIADVNGDTWADLIAAREPDSVSVLLGRGDMTFAPEVALAAGGFPRTASVGDLNDDGFQDLVIAIPSLDSLTMLLGRGDGTFAQGTPVATGIFPTEVAIADIDGDSRPDLAVACGGIGASVQLGNGDGTFAAPVLLQTGNEPQSIVVEDLNEDGRLDVAIAKSLALGEPISVFLGNGDGTFGSRSDSYAAYGALSLRSADFNRDNRPDLVVVHWGSGNVGVLLGNGDGSFGSGEIVPVPRRPRTTASGDLNEDGNLDVLVTSTINNVSVLFGTGGGSFGPSEDLGFAGGGITVADLNADGHSDVALSKASTVSIRLGHGDGTLSSAVDFGVGLSPTTPTAGDLNVDGHADLAVASSHFQSSSVFILLGRGDGSFFPSIELAVGAVPVAVALADLNGDRWLDIATVNRGDSTATVLLGSAGGSFGSRLDIPLGRAPTAVAMADWNGDTLVDLAVTVEGEYLHPGSVIIMLGHGDGTFGPPAEFGTGIVPGWLATTDFDGDGALDLAIVNSQSYTVSILLGNGDGRFRRRLDFGSGDTPTRATIGDLTGDGRPDLAVANHNSDSITILVNRSAPVPVDVEDFMASTDGDRVRLEWRLSSQAQRELQGVAVQCASDPSGPWERRTHTLLTPQASMSFVDSQADRVLCWYRLLLVAHQGSSRATHAVRAQMGADAGNRAQLDAPVELADGVHIRYLVPPPGALVRLALFDARGQLIWDQGRTSHESGSYARVWNRSLPSGAVAPRGIYLLRLEAGPVFLCRKLVLLHP